MLKAFKQIEQSILIIFETISTEAFGDIFASFKKYETDYKL
jgi:hypothetical protein